MMHALVLTWMTISQFRVASRRIRSDTVIERTYREEQHQLLATPHVMYAIRRHFHVPQALGELKANPAALGLEIVGDSEDFPKWGQVRRLLRSFQNVLPGTHCSGCDATRVQ
jgi:hypothetical protein